MPSAHSGTFRIDRGRSNWSNGKFPPNMSLTIHLTVEGDTFEYHVVNDTRPESLYLVDFVAKRDGQPYPSTGRGTDHVSMKQLRDDEYQLIKTLKGDITCVEYWRFVEDNDVVIKHGSIQREDGIMAYVEYFRRQ